MICPRIQQFPNPPNNRHHRNSWELILAHALYPLHIDHPSALVNKQLLKAAIVLVVVCGVGENVGESAGVDGAAVLAPHFDAFDASVLAGRDTRTAGEDPELDEGAAVNLVVVRGFVVEAEAGVAVVEPVDESAKDFAADRTELGLVSEGSQFMQRRLLAFWMCRLALTY